MKIEADGLSTSMVSYPKDAPERFALVLDHEENNMKMYFFVTREMVMEIVQSLVEMVGYDA